MQATAHRHSLLTKNLAKVNVANYKRQDADFGIELENAEGRAAGRKGKFFNQQSQFSRGNAVRVDGSSVELETEVMNIAEMEIRYQLLTEITSRHFSGLQSVIREGR
ncbi:hypothetical protein QPK87_17505 [Kamptonema cortianum]|nr:hypothetical protein [Geitlerinema splendidum]MDK3158351.1 hypothetical protein [Kamptonema cortianum]